MKALTQQELQLAIDYFSPVLDGTQLQDIISSDRGLALGFHGKVHYWLVLDLVPNAPMILLFQEYCPFKKGAKPKPLGLFLNSHAKNLYFESMQVQQESGRVVILSLSGSGSECELEIRLIPKQCNVIVKANDKQIAWEKPLELSPPPHVENPPQARTLEEIHEQWLAEQSSGKKPAQDPVVQWEKQKKKDLEKKRKALDEIERQINSQEYALWFEAGQFLKTHGHFSVPEHLKKCIDEQQSLSWNIERTFSKGKQLQQKKEGAQERLLELQKQIEQLERSTFKDKPTKTVLVDLMQKADARGRKLQLASGALAYCGRSAADNLALLRKAKAWDYWLHLRDFPGAHAIIHRQKDQLVSDGEIQQVAEWVAKESLSSKNLISDQKLAVVMVECRFVRPIKGDKLGRVTYHSERTISFTLRHG